MSVTAAGFVLSFLLSTAYGAGFHFLVGGPPRKILVYLVASWVGFAIGHFVGDFMDIELFKLGAIHLLTASLGSWITLLISWFLTKPRT